jgi:hypothetical protein
MRTEVHVFNHGVVAEELALARQLTDDLLPEHPTGGTYDPRTNSFPTFNDKRIYLVSIPGYESRLGEKPNARKLAAWLRQARKRLSVKQHYLGWWRDGRQWIFDISIALSGDQGFILRLAAIWGQQAVYHPMTNDVIYVPSPYRRAA